MERRETVDELKIQIESRQDLEYLRGEFLRAVQSTNIKNFIADPEEAQCFVDGVFSVVQENVQVDGIDYNCLPKELDCRFSYILFNYISDR